MIIINCRLDGHNIPLLSWLHPQLFIKDTIFVPLVVYKNRRLSCFCNEKHQINTIKMPHNYL